MEWKNCMLRSQIPLPGEQKESDKNGRKTKQYNKWGELAISEVELLTDSGIRDI